jgi:hypothetical protein
MSGFYYLKMIPAPKRIIKNTMYKNITHSFNVFGRFFIAIFFVVRSAFLRCRFAR